MAKRNKDLINEIEEQNGKLDNFKFKAEALTSDGQVVKHNIDIKFDSKVSVYDIVSAYYIGELMKKIDPTDPDQMQHQRECAELLQSIQKTKDDKALKIVDLKMKAVIADQNNLIRMRQIALAELKNEQQQAKAGKKTNTQRFNEIIEAKNNK